MSFSLHTLLESKPGLKALLSAVGDQTCTEYFASLRGTEIDTRLMTILHSFDRSIKKDAILHTADHIGILHHPFFWNIKSVAEEPIVVLATSNISPTNSSHPRSLVWHDQFLNEKRAHTISRKWRHSAMYGVPALDELSWLKFLDSLPKKIASPLKETIASSKFLDQKWLPQQLEQLSSALWQYFFSAPVIYIELEAVVNTSIEMLLSGRNNTLHRLCTERDLQEKYLLEFSGIQGAHHEHLQHGSHFFWHIDHAQKKRVVMNYDRGILRAGEYSIELSNTNAIIAALQARELMPTLALSYGLLACEFGATLAGGFSQIDYLPKIIEAWTKTFGRVSDSALGDVFAGEVGLVSIRSENNYALATLADLLLYCDSAQEIRKLKESLREVTLRHGIEAMHGELLKILNPKSTIDQKPAEILVDVTK